MVLVDNCVGIALKRHQWVITHILYTVPIAGMPNGTQSSKQCVRHVSMV